MPAAQQQVPGDFLTSLRNATARQHTQLESADLSRKLLSDAVTIDDYKSYLLKMKNIVVYCEQEIFPLVENVVTDIKSRIKLPLIEHDLAYLHVDIKTANSFQPIIKNTSTAYALGFMYVMEGSTLGSRIIIKHLKNKLNITEDDCGTFFAGYKTLTSVLWKDFLQSLSMYESQNKCAGQIIEGAQDAFESIYNYFSNTTE